MDLGKRIRKARKAKKLTQEQIGTAVSVSDATINRYEKGIRQPDPEMLRLIADVLDVSVDYLLGRTETPRLKTEVNEFDYSQLFTQQDEGQAYILAADLRYRYKLSDETFLKIIDEKGAGNEHPKGDCGTRSKNHQYSRGCRRRQIKRCLVGSIGHV